VKWTRDRSCQRAGNRCTAVRAVATTACRTVPWQARLVLLAAIWGISFLFIKVGDESLAPLQVALGRLVLGTATILLIVAVRRESVPRGGEVWFHRAVAALLFNALPFSLFAFGEKHTTSILAGIWNATTPLFTLPIATLVLADARPNRQQIAGGWHWLITPFVTSMPHSLPAKVVGGAFSHSACSEQASPIS